MPRHIWSIGFAALLFASVSFAQYGSIQNRAINLLNENRVRTTFYNYGLLGNVGEISFEWPQGTGDEYMGDFSPLLGVEFVHPSGDTLRSVCTSYGPRGNPDGPPGGGAFWGFEPLPGFHRVNTGETPHIARSDQPNTWPSSWSNHWLGHFPNAQQWADQEAYFQMDDNADMEWRVRGTDTLFAFPNDTSRSGLGLRVEGRYLEFLGPDLEDMIVLMYVFHNDGVINFLSMRFGVIVGTLVGGRQDSADDLFYYSADHEIAITIDSDDIGSPGWVPLSDSINVGAIGTTFLKTPADLGVTSFELFSPPGAVRMNDDAALWSRLTPGNFDTPTPEPTDGDFILGTGNFQLSPGSVDTVVTAVVFGIDPNDVIRKADYLRNLYDSGQIMEASEPREPQIISNCDLSVFPNPFNSSVTININVRINTELTVTLYDILGREVDVLHRGRLSNSVLRYSAPASLVSGIYFIRAWNETNSFAQKIVFMK